MTAFAWAAQEGVYDTMANDATLLALLAGGVQNSRPKPAETTYPYATFFSTQLVPDDVSTETDGVGDSGVSEFYDIHVYDQASSGVRGDKNLREILDRLHTLFHGASITVTGRASAHSWIRNVVKFTEGDDVTEHMVVTIEVIHRL